MTILEQILAGLQTKFSGVDAAILTRIATKKADGVTDESQVPTIVEGISFSDVLTNYGDFRAGDASFKSVQTYEKKHNLKDGKPIETTTTQQQTTTAQTEQQPDMAKIIADAVSAAVKPLSDKLSQFETEKTQATRQEQILTKAKEYGIPETLLPMLKIADDADLDTYFKDAKQTFANEGFKGVVSPDSSEQNLEKETSAIAKMISDGTKEIVEQNKN